MAKLTLTADQLATLAGVLKKLTAITAETSIDFCGFGSWDIDYADNYIRITKNAEGEYLIDNFCS
jgi:hypothetical protein